MRVAVVTDDTPSIGVRWEDLGRWRRKRTFIFPGDDVFEKIIREDNVRLPLRRILHGRFIEVASFVEELRNLYPTDLFILSGKVGIVDGDDLIDLRSYMRTEDAIDPYPRLKAFLRRLSSTHTHMILLLPTERLAREISSSKLDKDLGSFNCSIIIGGAKVRTLLEHHDDCTNMTLLPKLGIARVGRENREIILELLSGKD